MGKVVGIIGGMGPEATIDLMQRILRVTPARDDADHIHCLVDNNPQVPSRIKAIIEGTGESPIPCLAGMARNLEAWGADLLIIPCNTAHYYLPDIRAAVHIPVLDMVAITLNAIRQALPFGGKGARLGLLASPALRITRLYEEKTRALGAEILYPEDTDQEEIFQLIKAVKAGQHTEAMRQSLAGVMKRLVGNGATAAIIACTELGVMGKDLRGIPVFDAAEELVKETVRMVKADDFVPDEGSAAAPPPRCLPLVHGPAKVC